MAEEAKKSLKRKEPDPEDPTELLEPLDEVQLESEYDQVDDDVPYEEEVQNNEIRNVEIALKSQLPSTRDSYDGIKITPFNMKEELDEGEFDSEGNYIFSKPDPEDNWANSIDWDNIKSSQIANKPDTSRTQPDNDNDVQDSLTKTECYKRMLRILRHDETVQRCIQRLGRAIPKRFPKKNTNKSRLIDKDTQSEQEIADVRAKLNLMTELANRLLGDGDDDIYQRSYEELEDFIN